MSSATALVIIDVQVGVIEPAYRKEEVLDNINILLTRARATATPVLYIQHTEPKGYELEAGTPPWQIHSKIAPQEGEPIVQKQAADAFHRTTLQQELESRGVKHLVVAGAQTEYCIDTSVRRATTCGYSVTLVGDAHTTHDMEEWKASSIIAFHNTVLNGFTTDTHSIRVTSTQDITF